jgi:hypothetical protein
VINIDVDGGCDWLETPEIEFYNWEENSLTNRPVFISVTENLLLTVIYRKVTL